MSLRLMTIHCAINIPKKLSFFSHTHPLSLSFFSLSVSHISSQSFLICSLGTLLASLQPAAVFCVWFPDCGQLRYTCAHLYVSAYYLPSPTVHFILTVSLTDSLAFIHCYGYCPADDTMQHDLIVSRLLLFHSVLLMPSLCLLILQDFC